MNATHGNHAIQDALYDTPDHPNKWQQTWMAPSSSIIPTNDEIYMAGGGADMSSHVNLLRGCIITALTQALQAYDVEELRVRLIKWSWLAELTPLYSNRHAYTVRLLTHVLCKPTHFVFPSLIAAMSYSLQTSLNSVMKDWADKWHVWGTPTRSPSRSISR